MKRGGRGVTGVRCKEGKGGSFVRDLYSQAAWGSWKVKDPGSKGSAQVTGEGTFNCRQVH